jgi:HAD superfamily hydrolase (TIGR01509 family)
MGKSKQDSTIFDDIAEELQVTPEQIFFIDDSTGNIERAQKKGLQTVLYKDKELFIKELAASCPLLNFV